MCKPRRGSSPTGPTDPKLPCPKWLRAGPFLPADELPIRPVQPHARSQPCAWGMLMKSLWTRPWGLWRPPVASFTLMVLLCLLWLAGVDESLALSPNLLLSSPFQVYRLMTYCLCLTETPLFILNLLLFPLLSWPQERRQGTLRYLHSSALGAFASALLYLLLAWLQGAQAGSAVGGYTPVHLALLGCPQGRRRQGAPQKWASPPLLAVLLLGLSWILSPSSPFLLHLSGLLTGLAFWAGVFSPLELSERRLEKLHGGIIFKTLPGRGSFLHFVLPPAEPAEILPTADPAARRDRILRSPESPTQAFPPADSPTQPLFLASPPASYWSGETAALEQECRQSVAAGSLPPFPAHHGALSPPFSALQRSLMDEELLRAGIQASLQDMVEEEVKLYKSSVSSLRLQQLQKMGFPTERAVVALAATGHVEGAVSLLIGGHVGDQAVVTAESRSAHR